MKKLSVITLTIAMATLLFTACKKSDDSSSTTVTPSMTAKVAGVDWSTSNAVAAYNDTLGTTKILSITGVTSTYSSITFPVSGYVKNATGTYAIAAPNSAMYAVSATTGFKYSFSGSVTITSADASAIKGTFNFTCSDSTKVTEGTFTVATPANLK